MSNLNDNQTENWYAPLQTEPQPVKTAAAKPVKERRIRPWYVLGLVGLLVLAIVLSSIAFSGMGGSAPEREKNDKTQTPDKLPDNWEDFIEQYYQSVETDVARIDIPEVALPIDYTLPLAAAGEELSLQELYACCADTIVAISGYETEDSVGYSWGTGVIISEDGLILTNTHVIDKCCKATVTLFDDRQFEAKLVGADSISDIAVLKIGASGLPVAEFGESSNLRVGDRVAAIGNPLGQSFRSTLTDGIISAIERGVHYNGHSMTLLQTNTALNEGNSGGALFNMYGQVIGITNMKMMSSYSSIEGIAFAIPSATVKRVVDSLVEYGEVRGRPALGITVGAIPSKEGTHYDKPEGLYVSDVTKGTDAEAKGVVKGDIILEVNHTKVKTTEEISEIKDTLQVGDTMLLTIWRDGKTLEIGVTLMDQNDIYGG